MILANIQVYTMWSSHGVSTEYSNSTWCLRSRCFFGARKCCNFLQISRCYMVQPIRTAEQAKLVNNWSPTVYLVVSTVPNIPKTHHPKTQKKVFPKMLKNVFKMIFESWKIFKNFEKKSENFRKFSKISKKKWFFFRLFFEFQISAPLFWGCPTVS